MQSQSLNKKVLDSCVKSLIKDPSGQMLSKRLKYYRLKGLLSEEQETNYFFEAEKIAFGANLTTPPTKI